MNAQTQMLSDWRLESRREPVIRVGVVLPNDDLQELCLEVPPTAGPYRVLLDSLDVGPLPAGSMQVILRDSRVILRQAALPDCVAGVIRLVPQAQVTLDHATGLVLRDLPTGRGFHWQKRVSFSLPGILEFRAGGASLLAVNELPLEAYLACVVTSEMSGACPLEFLKSQILVARSWVLVHTEDKHPGLPIDRCNDDCCQRYQGTTFLNRSAVQATASTRGQAIFHAGGGIVDANYSKSCGGLIEAPEYLWGASKPGQRSAVDAPPYSSAQRFRSLDSGNLSEYLTGPWLGSTDVFCSPNMIPEDQLPRYLGGVDEGGRYFRWRIRYAREQLEDLLRNKAFRNCRPEEAADLGTLVDLQPLARGRSGRIVELAVHYREPTGRAAVRVIRDQYRIRDALHEKFLYSSAFQVEVERSQDGPPGAFTLVGAGWGHGAGLCQIGALGMALHGHDAGQIVRHYFENVSVRECYGPGRGAPDLSMP